MESPRPVRERNVFLGCVIAGGTAFRLGLSTVAGSLPVCCRPTKFVPAWLVGSGAVNQSSLYRLGRLTVEGGDSLSAVRLLSSTRFADSSGPAVPCLLSANRVEF